MALANGIFSRIAAVAGLIEHVDEKLLANRARKAVDSFRSAVITDLTPEDLDNTGAHPPTLKTRWFEKAPDNVTESDLERLILASEMLLFNGGFTELVCSMSHHHRRHMRWLRSHSLKEMVQARFAQPYTAPPCRTCH